MTQSTMRKAVDLLETEGKNVETWRDLLSLALRKGEDDAIAGQVLLEVWHFTNPGREWSLEVLRHLREEHGPENRQGECSICIAKALHTAGTKAMEGGEAFTNAMSPLLGNNPVYTDENTMAIFLASRALP